MREISLITGQLHRAIYNLNEEARRSANQKFESGLPSAPQRSLKKAFDQFRQSLHTGDPTVRRRTASLLVTLVRNFTAIPASIQPDVLALIETGLCDTDDQVREATVESYSLMLPQIDEGQLNRRETSTESNAETKSPPADSNETNAQPDSDAKTSPQPNTANALTAPIAALHRILRIAISDPAEIVREAAAVSVAVQKSIVVKETGVQFFLSHIDDSRFRWACRSIQSLAEFPDYAPVYLDRLNPLLNDGHWRFRRAALLATLRLARLEILPAVLLPNVVRRMFETNPKISNVAQEIVQISIARIARDDEPLSGFLTECLWLSRQHHPDQHLAAIVETTLVNLHHDPCNQTCHDRFDWRITNEAGGPSNDTDRLGNADKPHRPRPALQTSIDQLANVGGRAEIGWVAGWIVSHWIQQSI